MGDTPWPSLPSPSFCHNWDTSFNTKVIHSVSLCCHLVFVSEQPFVLFCPTLLPQIEVVNTFKSGTSFQGAGALRRQSSTTSQTQDVTNVSSPSHVSLSNALSSPTSTTAATAPSTTGRESDLCQSASLLSLLQGCHHVMNQKLLGLKQITFSILCGWHLWRVFFFSFVLSALSIPLSLSSVLFCCSYGISDSSWYFLPHLGVLSSHWWMYVFPQSARSAGLRVIPTAWHFRLWVCLPLLIPASIIPSFPSFLPF